MITKMNLVFLKKTKYDDDIPFKILLPFDLTNFYHMFKRQLKFKMRHTINSNLVDTKNSIFSDYND